MEDLVIYLTAEEFKRQFTIPKKNKAAFPQHLQSGPNEESCHITNTLLCILNNELRPTDFNKEFTGAIFKKYVHPLMRSQDARTQLLAVQFVRCAWVSPPSLSSPYPLILTLKLLHL